MNNKAMYAAALTLSLMAAGSAFAQDRNDRNDHDRNDRPQAQHDNRNDHRNDHRDNGPDRRNDRNDYQARDYHNNGPRGAGPRHDMRRGQRIPAEYRGNQYVVNDWRGHHLSAPPRGQHWVQTGGDYVLVAVATGIIASVLLGN